MSRSRYMVLAIEHQTCPKTPTFVHPASLPSYLVVMPFSYAACRRWFSSGVEWPQCFGPSLAASRPTLPSLSTCSVRTATCKASTLNSMGSGPQFQILVKTGWHVWLLWTRFCTPKVPLSTWYPNPSLNPRRISEGYLPKPRWLTPSHHWYAHGKLWSSKTNLAFPELTNSRNEFLCR